MPPASTASRVDQPERAQCHWLQPFAKWSVRAPDWDRLPEGLPSPLRRLLRRCFVKDRHQRLQHIGDARLELQDARDAGPEGDGIDRAPDAAKLRGVGVTTVVLAVLAAAAVGALGMWALSRSEAQAPPQRRVFSINLEHPLQSGGLTARPFDISADGSMLVYAGNIGPQASLYLRRLNDLEVRPIPGTEGAGDPIFSPDGILKTMDAFGLTVKGGP